MDRSITTHQDRQRYTVTTPIYYATKPPHVGHAYTTIAADVLARLHRNVGQDVHFLTGTDEHGAKVAEIANQSGQGPQEYTDTIASQYQEAWKALAIQYDDFIRTTEQRHVQGVQKATQYLKDEGFLYEKSYSGLYCVGCESFVSEDDLDEKGLEPLHQRKPEIIEEKNWFFALEKVLPSVRKLITDGTFHIVPLERRNEVLGLLEHGMEDFSVSRPAKRVPWGIPMPFDSTQTIYVWVDALLNYVTALGYGSSEGGRMDRFWPADVHIIGPDILKFHAIYWPAILLALGQATPRMLAVHGYFTVDGKKMSKTLGNEVSPFDLVQRYGSDAARYLILSGFPFGQSGDVAQEKFDERYNADLAHTFGNFVSRVTQLIGKYANGEVPDIDPDDTFIQPVKDAASRLRKEMLDNAPDKEITMVRSFLVEIGGVLNTEIDRAAPWLEKDDIARDRVLRGCIEAVFLYANLVSPLLPNAAQAVRHALSADSLPYDGSEGLSPGMKVTKPESLFPKVS